MNCPKCFAKVNENSVRCTCGFYLITLKTLWKRTELILSFLSLFCFAAAMVMSLLEANYFVVDQTPFIAWSILIGLGLALLAILAFFCSKSIRRDQKLLASKILFVITGIVFFIIIKFWLGLVGLALLVLFCNKSITMDQKLATFNILAAISGIGFVLYSISSIFSAIGHGRPLRIRGRARSAKLKCGPTWSRGDCPDLKTQNLDSSTRQTLEAFWLEDAKMEHASVPAFFRLGWQLAGVGVPPELLRAVCEAALEEIDHAQKCFSLAEGYGGREAMTVEPMPELLTNSAAIRGNPFIHLTSESLMDGCLLEEFNADVALCCAENCQEESTKVILLQIAREERSHAALSWKVVRFCLENEPIKVAKLLQKSLRTMHKYPRPTAVSKITAPLVAYSQIEALRKNGRIPDIEWEKMWFKRLELTKQKISTLIENPARLEIQA